ncbi:hypothetical protein EB796_008613 [Bugula neritina]|uniref:Uncharacterized protein n=1 Tax=Bugula neritina TaxID=10212 RepID=A0A7J7K326_BUGNE|nr:hypothetical protein EB796_008613 [Bugula neritina]
MTNAGVTNYDGNSPLHPDGVLERLVRSGDRLVAKKVDIDEAAHFLVKRFPPVCNETKDYSLEKPLHVQLMLIDVDSEYHQSLLQVQFNTRNQLEVKFVKPSDPDCPPPGHNVVTPSVHPGTLFTMLYGPWIE